MYFSHPRHKLMEYLKIQQNQEVVAAKTKSQYFQIILTHFIFWKNLCKKKLLLLRCHFEKKKYEANKRMK